MSGSPSLQPPGRQVLKAQTMEDKDAEIAAMRSTIELLRENYDAESDTARRYKEGGEEKDAEIKNLRRKVKWLRARLRVALRNQQKILRKFEGRCDDLAGYGRKCMRRATIELDHVECLGPLHDIQESPADEKASDEDDTPSE